MEEDAMEQIRARLAAATSAASALAESLEHVDENPLQTLQKWMAIQTGVLKCGHCLAQLPRGKEASVCIACGNARPPQPSEFNFKVSFAFLQFLETIHSPIKVGSSRKRNSLLLPRPQIQATRPSGEELADHVKSPLGKALSREGSAAGKDQSLSESREVSSDDRSGFSNAYKVAETAKFEDLHETSDVLATDSNLAVTALNSVRQVVQMQNQDLSYLETLTGNNDVKDITAKRNSEPVSNWNFLSPVCIAEAEGQKQDNATVSLGHGFEEASTASSQVPDYDLSFFETFGGKSKEESTAKSVDTAGDYWHSYAKSRDIKQGNINALERFTSDASAFTTLTDGDSDSENSTFEAFPPPKPPLDILMEVGGSGREDDLIGPLESFDGGDIQEVLITTASPPLSTVDPFSWPLEVLEASTSIPAKDFQSAPDRLASNPTSSVAPSVDPFLWPLEESDQPSSTKNLGKRQEVLIPSVSDPLSVSIMGVDPFSWPLETFNQPILASNVASGTVIEPSLPAPVDDRREEDTPDWSEDEFVWSQAEPSNQSLGEDPFVASTEKSPAQPEFQPRLFNLEVSLEKDSFILDQSTPRGTSENPPPSSPGRVMSLGLALEGLAISKGEAPTEDSEYSRSIHVRSVSFGKSETTSAPLNQIEDLFKRSVSSGNLHSNIHTQSDDLFNQLLIPSATSNLPLPTRQLGDQAEDLLEFLNLKPASSTDSKAASDRQKENSMKPLHVRSVSFGTLELLPEEQSEDMFQFFHSRSHSAGSSEMKSSPAENGNSSDSAFDIFDRLHSPVRATDVEKPSGSEDLVNFIKEAVPSPPKTQSTGVEEVTEDDDDFFEWQSAETLPASTSQTGTQSSVPTQATTNQEVLFHLAPSPPQSFPVTSPKKPGSPSGLSSLAGTFPEKSASPQRKPSPDDKDLFQSLSRKSPSTGGLQTSQIVNMDAFSWPHPASGQLAYGSEEEFSDFVSNNAAPAPQPVLSQLGKALASKPALDLSFVEQLQPSTHERHNSDFFGDLMCLNFTNT